MIFNLLCELTDKRLEIPVGHFVVVLDEVFLGDGLIVRTELLQNVVYLFFLQLKVPDEKGLLQILPGNPLAVSFVQLTEDLDEFLVFFVDELEELFPRQFSRRSIGEELIYDFAREIEAVFLHEGKKLLLGDEALLDSVDRGKDLFFWSQKE